MSNNNDRVHDEVDEQNVLDMLVGMGAARPIDQKPHGLTIDTKDDGLDDGFDEDDRHVFSPDDDDWSDDQFVPMSKTKPQNE